MYTWTPCVWSRAESLIAAFPLAEAAEPPVSIGCTLPPQYETAWTCRGPQHTPWIVHNITVWFGRNFLSFACELKVNWVDCWLGKFKAPRIEEQQRCCHHLPLRPRGTRWVPNLIIFVLVGWSSTLKIKIACFSETSKTPTAMTQKAKNGPSVQNESWKHKVLEGEGG